MNLQQIEEALEAKKNDPPIKFVDYLSLLPSPSRHWRISEEDCKYLLDLANSETRKSGNTRTSI